MYENRHVVGLMEKSSILDDSGNPIPGLKDILVRIDSGATIGSIDKEIIKDLNLPELGKKVIKSSLGTSKRTIVKVYLELAGQKIHGKFTITDRSHMTYPILIGQDILKQNYIIDPQKE